VIIRLLLFSLLFLFNSCIDTDTESDSNLSWLLEEDKKPGDEGSEFPADSDQLSSQENSQLIASDATLNPAERLLELSVTISIFDARGQIIGLGSGVYVGENLIATNFHVVEKDHAYITISRNSDNLEFSGTIFKLDPAHDVAIVKTEHTCESPIKISRNLPKIGDDIMVAGSPQGLTGTISKGIVSSIRKFDPYDYELIQISAPISQGSSGGPVVNNKGELIGISVSGMQEGQNLNFAVPVKYISHLLD